jgi:hypothetical protein
MNIYEFLKNEGFSCVYTEYDGDYISIWKKDKKIIEVISREEGIDANEE